MNTLLIALANVLPIASSSSDGYLLALLLAGPVGGGVVYWMIYRYYRNTDKTHHFEAETRVEARPATGSDSKVNSIRGTRRREIPGRNDTEHRARVRRF